MTTVTGASRLPQTGSSLVTGIGEPLSDHAAPPLPSGSFLPGPNFFFRGGAGGPHQPGNNGGFPVNIAADGPCAYRVSLSWHTRHYGETQHGTEILYCK